MIIAFFNKYGKSIIENITDTDLFFPAVIAQLSVESKWGASGLSTQHNNFGGVKATGSQFSSGKASMDTTEYVNNKLISVKQDFAKYPDFDNFMKDYVRVLKLPQYVNAGVFTAATPEDQILAMGKGGYSTTDPNRYLNDCKGRIEAARDEYKFGKISTKVSQPTVVSTAWSSNTGLLANTQNSINNALSGAGLKPIWK